MPDDLILKGREVRVAALFLEALRLGKFGKFLPEQRAASGLVIAKADHQHLALFLRMKTALLIYEGSPGLEPWREVVRSFYTIVQTAHFTHVTHGDRKMQGTLDSLRTLLTQVLNWWRIPPERRENYERIIPLAENLNEDFGLPPKFREAWGMK